jgi:hypothetical protein
VSRRRTQSTKGINTRRLLQALSMFGLVVLLPLSGFCREAAFEPADYEKIPPEYRDKVRSVVRFPTVYKKKPVPSFESDMLTHAFLLNDLPLASKLARSARISKYVVEQESSGLAVTDKAGLEGMLYPVYEEPGRHLFYGEGSCDVRFLPKLSGKGVMEVAFKRTDDGKVENRVRVWIKLDSKVFSVVGKLLFPLVGKAMNKKTGALGGAAKKLSERLYSEPEKLYETLEKSGLATDDELDKLKRFLEGRSAASPSPAPPPRGD